MGGIIMLVAILLGGVISLLLAMLANDAIVYVDHPVATENWIPMVILIGALGSLTALIVMG